MPTGQVALGGALRWASPTLDSPVRSRPRSAARPLLVPSDAGGSPDGFGVLNSCLIYG